MAENNSVFVTSLFFAFFCQFLLGPAVDHMHISSPSGCPATVHFLSVTNTTHFYSTLSAPSLVLLCFRPLCTTLLSSFTSTEVNIRKGKGNVHLGPAEVVSVSCREAQIGEGGRHRGRQGRRRRKEYERKEKVPRTWLSSPWSL